MGGVIDTITFSGIPPYARVILNPNDAIDTPGAAVGSLKVVGNQPLAGISLEHPTEALTTNDLQASRAFVENDYGEKLYCPMVRRDWGNLDATSGIQVQNVGNATTNITVTYKIIRPSPSTVTVTKTGVAPGASKNFLQAEDLPPGGYLASAIITNSNHQNLAAIVSDRADGVTPQRYLTYACFKDTLTVTKISLPLVKEEFPMTNPNTSGIQVQNIGSTYTYFKLTYVTHNNETYTVVTTQPINSGESKTFRLLTIPGNTPQITISPTDLTGLEHTINGVIVESLPWNGNDAQPIVAIAVESSLDTNNYPQDTKAYEGVNIP
jgi:hypothetical protein